MCHTGQCLAGTPQSPTIAVPVTITTPGHSWRCFSLAGLAPSIMLRIPVSVHSRNQAALLRPWVSKHFALTQENYNWQPKSKIKV